MLCTNCNMKEANFHYKRIIDGQKTEQHLCSECAQSLGYLSQSENIFGIGSILNDFIAMPISGTMHKTKLNCPYCNTGYDEFKRTGLLGCDKCYDAFASAIEAILSRIQPATVHKGTLEGETGEKIRKKNELSDLKDELKKAIIEERYEDAAVLRDKIKNLEEDDNGKMV